MPGIGPDIRFADPRGSGSLFGGPHLMFRLDLPRIRALHACLFVILLGAVLSRPATATGTIPEPAIALTPEQNALLTQAGTPGDHRGGPPARLIESSPDSALALTLRRMPGTPLSLDDAVAMALRNAPAAREAVYALAGAEAVLKRERGVFDPELFGDVERSGRDEPTSSPFSGADVLETDRLHLAAGSRIRLRYGTELEATLNGTKSATNSAFTALDPQYESFGALALRQPLLKGFAPAARADLTAAERNLEASRAAYRDALAGVRAGIESVYWDLYAAERDYAVQELTRDRAAAFLEETRTRADAGLVGPGQVASARVFLAEQEQSLLDQKERLGRVSDALASLIGHRPAPGERRFRPTEEPQTEYIVESPAVLLDRAMQANHAVHAAEQAVEATHARVRGARWDALPALDLRGSIGGIGLAGDPQEVEFGDIVYRSDRQGDFSDAWSEVFERNYATWAVGLELSIPLGLREGAGERERLQAERRRAEERLRALKLALEEEVRARHRELVHGQKRLRAAREGVAAAQEQVRIGLVEYRAGQATAFELVRLGADLAAAQQRYSQALVRTAKAAAQLRRLTGEFPEAETEEAR
ncbi:MAG: hypothetical protein GF355_04820 [Candidatus Eisenbacteria bacterium]|nr:hypothetical protein [Candidatus Eisenbacteria bacterium]